MCFDGVGSAPLVVVRGHLVAVENSRTVASERRWVFTVEHDIVQMGHARSLSLPAARRGRAVAGDAVALDPDTAGSSARCVGTTSDPAEHHRLRVLYQRPCRPLGNWLQLIDGWARARRGGLNESVGSIRCVAGQAARWYSSMSPPNTGQRLIWFDGDGFRPACRPR